MKKLSEHPYSVTSIIFLLILFIGAFFLYWREDQFAFLLLIYFLVTIGIRLDDISKQLGSGHNRASQISDDEVTVAVQLNEINSSLLSIDKSLKEIVNHINQEQKTTKEEKNEDSEDYPFS